MDDCIIEIDQNTGQLKFCQGGHLLSDIWGTTEELQAFDRQNGQRYMVSVQQDRVRTREISLH